MALSGGRQETSSPERNGSETFLGTRVDPKGLMGDLGSALAATDGTMSCFSSGMGCGMASSRCGSGLLRARQPGNCGSGAIVFASLAGARTLTF